MLAAHWADTAIQVLLGSRLGNKSPLTAHKLQLKIAFTGSSGNNNKKKKTRRRFRKCRSAKCRRAQNEKASHVENFIRRDHHLQKNSEFNLPRKFASGINSKVDFGKAENGFFLFSCKMCRHRWVASLRRRRLYVTRRHKASQPQRWLMARTNREEMWTVCFWSKSEARMKQ